MEFGSIQRELYIEASPEIVFDVVSRPEHVSQWWADEAEFTPVPGSTGRIAFVDSGHDEPFTVVEAKPPHHFSFRWTHPAGEDATETNSYLVSFDLTASGPGTLLRFTETGFRERGWEAAVLEEQYRDHVRGWDLFLPRLTPYAETLGARS
jgi:uncharacterized protein YndB with AHSA1/START domain